MARSNLKFFEVEDRVIVINRNQSSWGDPKREYYKRGLNARARLAEELVARFGSIAAKPSSAEDSAGRNVLELQSTDEVVERAVTIANKLHDEFARLGWFVEYPDPRNYYELDD